MTTIKVEQILEGPQTTTDSQLVVSMAGFQLPVGQHQLSLSVSDSSNNTSKTPAIITIFVVDTEAPTPRLELRNEEGQLVPENQIPFGATFVLDGSRSADTGGGTIVSYEWSLIRQ